jgi:hypothetical protein
MMLAAPGMLGDWVVVCREVEGAWARGAKFNHLGGMRRLLESPHAGD